MSHSNNTLALRSRSVEGASVSRVVKRLCGGLIVAVLGGCASLSTTEESGGASPLLTDSNGASLILTRTPTDRTYPAGWEPWILHPAKKRTRYARGTVGDEAVIRAHADSAASGLARPLALDPLSAPVIEWRWRVDSLIKGADNTDRYAEDSPVRIVLAFDGDKRSLPMRDQLFFEQARFLSGGREMPYATLMYIWENRQPVNTVLQNPHTTRVRKIVVASGDSGVGTWQQYRRNIVDDYRQAFGQDPGQLIGVAILTDTDNTKEKVSSQYGKIRLLPR